MKIWDINRMIGPLPHDPFGMSLSETLTEMNRLGIERALVSHSYSRYYDPAYGNDQLLTEWSESDENTKQKLVPVWTYCPLSAGEFGNIDEGYLIAKDIHGVRLWPHDHNYRFDDPDLSSLLDTLAATRIPVLLDLPQTDWPAIHRVCNTHPDLRLVLCNVGYRSLRQLLAALMRYRYIYVDLSFFAAHQGVEFLLDRFGPERLIFGSGAPEKDTGGALARLFYSICDEGDLETMAWLNMKRLLEGRFKT